MFNMKRTRRLPKSLVIFLAVVFLAIILLACALFMNPAIGEGDAKLLVTASILNGRAWPRTTAKIEAFYDDGEWVDATGKWSDDRKWIEVIGGETGTVWCAMKYLTERPMTFKVINENRSSVKIRKHPVDGAVVGYLKPGKTLKITQVVLGWGKCKSGWVDLDYLVELVE